jgi:hypothetical protein
MPESTLPTGTTVVQKKHADMDAETELHIAQEAAPLDVDCRGLILIVAELVPVSLFEE